MITIAHSEQSSGELKKEFTRSINSSRLGVFLTLYQVVALSEQKLSLVFVKHYAPNCLTQHCLTPTLLAHDGNNSTNIQDFNVILSRGK